jgi:hypothetical protein
MLFVWAWSHVLAGRRSANRTEFDEAIVAIRANEIFRLRGGTHGQDREDWEKAKRQLRLEAQRDARRQHALAVLLTGLGLLLALGVGFALTTLVSDWFGYSGVVVSRHLTRPEALQILFGLVCGTLLLQWWPADWRPYFTATGAYVILAALPIAAILLPHLDDMAKGLTKLKAGVVELEFGNIKAQSRPTVDAERERFANDPFERLQQFPMIVPLDRDFAKVDGGAQTTAAIEAIDSASRFFDLIEPLIWCAASVKDRYPDEGTVQVTLLPIALDLVRLLPMPGAIPKKIAGPGNQAAAPTAPEKVLFGAIKKADAELRQRFGVDCASSAHLSLSADKQPPPTLPKDWPAGLALSVMAQGPHIHVFLANLLWFTVGLDGGRDSLARIVEHFPEDMNVQYLYAQLLYASDRDFGDVAGQLVRVLTIRQEQAATVARLPQTGAPIPSAKIEELRERYKRAYRIVTNDYAFWAAQSGTSELIASGYADDNYKNLREVSVLRGMDCIILDTFGYVKLAFSRKHADTAAQQMVGDAERFFQEARDCARRLPESRQRRHLLKVFDLHLRQANVLARDLH